MLQTLKAGTLLSKSFSFGILTLRSPKGTFFIIQSIPQSHRQQIQI